MLNLFQHLNRKNVMLNLFQHLFPRQEFEIPKQVRDDRKTEFALRLDP